MHKRIPMMAANWKMNFSISDSLKFITNFSHELKVKGDVDVLLFPSFTALYSVSVAISEMEYKFGAQNIHWEDKGAFTGEVSGTFLKEVGCEYVIIGHSERRHVFNEKDEWLKEKVRAAQRHGIVPILCVGEKLDEREAGRTWEVVERQLKSDLSLYNPKLTELVIAYEPVWAIGTGKNATAAEAQEVHAKIRSWLKTHFDPSLADQIRILYGGSVKGDNSGELIKNEDIDGFLVGGASLDPVQFADIVRSCY